MRREISETATAYLTRAEQESLSDFLRHLDEMCGRQVARVILFGSRARGDHTPESDIDLLVVGSDGVAEINAAIGGRQPEMGALSVLVMSQDDYRRHQWLQDPLYVNVRRDGIELWDRARFIAEDNDIPLRFPEGQRRPMDAATREVIEDYMTVATRQLGEARTLLKAGFGEGAISRSYFAVFHAASAALYSVNVVRGKHSGVQGAISQFLVRPGRLDKRYQDTYNRLFALRQTSDYEPKYVASLDEAQLLVAEADAFVARVCQFLDEQPEGGAPPLETNP
ncbi:MAG: HEPN domain-containing protein [Anaerolineae bacterium]